jgi:hypothetical protein
MRRAEFEQRVLALWVSTRVPLTRTNLQVHTGVARPKLERWLDELVTAEVLEVDSDDAGERLYTVLGAARPATGLERIADVQKLEHLRATTHSPAGRGPSALAVRTGRKERKSLVASGALSFFFGPLGWLYAAPLKDALPAVLIYVLLFALVPSFLLTPLIGLGAPLSALFGVLYAWRYNEDGERTSIASLARRGDR